MNIPTIKKIISRLRIRRNGNGRFMDIPFTNSGIQRDGCTLILTVNWGDLNVPKVRGLTVAR